MNITHLIAAIVGVMVFFACAIVGGVAQREAWESDCEKLGMHRSGDVVYKCEKVTP